MILLFVILRRLVESQLLKDDPSDRLENDRENPIILRMGHEVLHRDSSDSMSPQTRPEDTEGTTSLSRVI